MKTFSRFTVATFALLIPVLASAQTTMVYRPELRGMVPQRNTAQGPSIARSAREEVARHEAMAQAYRAHANRRTLADPASHCDRMAAQLRSKPSSDTQAR